MTNTGLCKFSQQEATYVTYVYVAIDPLVTQYQPN